MIRMLTPATDSVLLKHFGEAQVSGLARNERENPSAGTGESLVPRASSMRDIRQFRPLSLTRINF